MVALIYASPRRDDYISVVIDGFTPPFRDALTSFCSIANFLATSYELCKYKYKNVTNIILNYKNM